MLGHEPVAVPVAQVRPFTAEGLRQQVAGRAGDVQDRGVELHEFHVAQLGPGPEREGVAVTRGDRRVGRLPEQLAGASGGQERGPGPDQRRPPRPVPDERPAAPAVLGQEVDGEAVLPDPHVGPGPRLLDDGPHDLAPGGVAQGVDDPGVRVSPLQPQGDAAVDLIEGGPPADELGDPPRGLAHDHLDDLRVAEPLAGREGVGDVVVEVILRVQHAGDPALRVGAVALADLVLGDDQHAQRLGRPQRRPQAGQPPADHQHVGDAMGEVAGVDGGQVAPGKDQGGSHRGRATRSAAGLEGLAPAPLGRRGGGRS